MPVKRKLVILGECMVGKSNLAIRFARDRFDPDTQPNFGAAFFECGESGSSSSEMLRGLRAMTLG